MKKMDYWISDVSLSDKVTLAQIDALLALEGIRRDKNLDYICALQDDEANVVATGSCFGSTLRCFAVSHEHQGEGLLNQVITHLIDMQASRGNFHLFLYTKPDAARFFGDLGFYEISRVPGKLVFMENRRDGFPSYLRKLSKDRRDGRSAAIVMNANPFTLGHLHLVETAARACDTLHLFIVTEDLSLVPYRIRRQLIEAATAHIPNLLYHECGPYIISSATFPSYFLKDETDVIEGQAMLDIAVFVQIAAQLGITARWVGEEPTSQVTGLDNRIMSEALPKAGIDCRIIPRLTADGKPISASQVRECLKTGNMNALTALVPESTIRFFESPEATPILERIRQTADVRHY